VQAPTGTLHAVLQVVLPWLALLVAVGGAVTLFAFGRARGSRHDSAPPALWWALAVGVSVGLAVMSPELAIPEAQAARPRLAGWAVQFGMISAIVAILLGMLIGWVGSRLSRRA
jgi:hypothetical protein